MFHRMRQTAPRLWRQMKQIECPRRNLSRDWEDRIVPMFRPWKQMQDHHNVWDGLFNAARRDFEAMRRDMEKVMGQPFYGRYGRFPGEFKSESAEVKCNNRVYEIKMDMQSYEPEQITVKIQHDKLIISGKFEQKDGEHGFLSREFKTEFLIPENVDQDSICSSVSEDGFLMIQGKVTGAKEPKERVIEIDRTEAAKDKPSSES